MSRARHVDSRLVESASESRERFCRALRADVAWWRENAQAIPDETMKRTALKIAAELDELLHTLLVQQPAHDPDCRLCRLLGVAPPDAKETP